MRFCVVTPFDSANYGAFLQAYASKKFLENQGFEVCFMKWRDEKERKQEFFNKTKGFKATLRYIQKYGFLKKRYDVFSKARNVFNVVNSEQLKEGDAVVIGSDEVWNISVPKFQKECFYGMNVGPGVHRLAYAPSVANSSAADFDRFPELSKGMKEITLIGARDEETGKAYKSITGKDAELVCDPTLLITEDEWAFPSVENSLGKYILVYSYDIPKTHRKMLREVAKKQGCKLVAVGLYESWCDVNICCNPLEFYGIIKNAQAVYTTTFHGSIFTILNHKRCLIRATSKKVKDLLSRYELSSLMEPDKVDAETMERLLFTDRDYSSFDNVLKTYREKSRNLYSEKLGDISG